MDEICLYPYEIEVILADGGSSDNTLNIANRYEIKVVHSESGRATQMNAGAKASSGDLLWFVHVDTQLPKHWFTIIQNCLQQKTSVWGRFDVKLSGSSLAFRIIERSMNIRSKFTGICTGDQAIWILRDAFNEVGGFPKQALMEDIELSKRLKALSPPLRHKEPLITSSRYWEKHGIIRSVFRMWKIRLRYFLGTSPDILRDKYYGKDNG